MTIDTDSAEIQVAVGDARFSVFPSMGLPYTRIVQGLASRVRGVLWLTVVAPYGEVRFPVPNPYVPVMAGNSGEGEARAATMVLAKAVEGDLAIYAGTATDRGRKVTFKSISSRPDVGDGTSGTAPDEQTSGAFRANF